MEQRESTQVDYVPKILKNMVEICEVFGVGRATVQTWIREGAPVVVENGSRKPRYSAECNALQAWRVQRNMLSRSNSTAGCA